MVVTGVGYRYICSICFAQDGKVTPHTVGECKHKRTKKSRTGHGHCLSQCSCSDCFNESKGFWVESHIWKVWYSITNNYKSVVLNHNYVQVTYAPKASEFTGYAHAFKQAIQHFCNITLTTGLQLPL